jgi:hypothetical protein
MKYTRRQVQDAILALEICGQDYSSLHDPSIGISTRVQILANSARIAVLNTGGMWPPETRVYLHYLEAAAILREGWIPGRTVKRVNP